MRLNTYVCGAPTAARRPVLTRGASATRGGWIFDHSRAPGLEVEAPPERNTDAGNGPTCKSIFASKKVFLLAARKFADIAFCRFRFRLCRKKTTQSCCGKRI